MTAALDGQRRRDLRARQLNGIESVRVDADSRTVQVRLLGKLTFTPSLAGVRIEPVGPPTGGQRERVRVTPVAVRPRIRVESTRPDRIDVVLDRLGDRDGYVIRLLATPADGDSPDAPPGGFDPRYACAAVSFIADCPDAPPCPGGVPGTGCGGCSGGGGCGGCGGSCTGCTGGDGCTGSDDGAGETQRAWLGDYLAKDYASLRQLVLDRRALVSPDWTDRQIPDLGIALAELFAYAGDQLSYTQDAIATEAYLGTARLRTSVRRHLRLAGYRMHDGCNARSWVVLDVLDAGVLPAGSFRFITSVPQFDQEPVLESGELRELDPAAFEVFEPLPAAELAVRPAHNAIRFWTWGGEECELPRGATSATLMDAWVGEAERALDLSAGDVLVIEEARGPRTGVAGDADLRHRQAVRLTWVRPTEDEVYDQPLVQVGWDDTDALTFAACLSAVSGPDCCLIEDVTVARGNVVLTDHGRSEPWCGGEPAVITVPDAPPAVACCDGLGDPVIVVPAPRFTPVVPVAGVTHAAPFPDPASVARAQAARLDELIAEILDDPMPGGSGAEGLHQLARLTRLTRLAARARSGRTVPTDGDLGPAGTALVQDPRAALAQLRLTSSGEPWPVRPDLIGSGPDDPDVAAEVDDEGRSHLRFGDGELGRPVLAGQVFELGLRSGNGTAGNVAAGAISHLVSCGPLPVAISSVRNPMPGTGGVDPEPVALARQLGPTAAQFEPIQRAVIADDYATVIEALPGVQDAAADLAWNGSWYEAQAAIDPAGRTAVPRSLLWLADARMHEVRRIGHDVQPCEPDRIGVEITLQACLHPGAHADQADQQLRQVLSDGPSGALHPDRLRFGTDLAASALIAAAMAVPGVRSVTLLRLHRTGERGSAQPAGGVLTFGPLELPVAGTLTIELVPPLTRAREQAVNGHG